MSIVILEGQKIPLTPEQSVTDESIVNTLLPFYPDVANATISRKVVDGEEHIEIVKKVGTKGNFNLIKSLQTAPELINPALSLSWKLKQLEILGQLTLETLVSISEEIEVAIAQGEQATKATISTIAHLTTSPPIPSKYPIPNF
ncbi:hypothetical protein H6S82_00765 [Planktothrix sp. FACHB-1355]|uniref:Uncharacterized protein n=1 Tax=Aerosakkonema funiforme FACHB-1375 TaxID=2949571 RepID=A0A926ZEZ5_9CYAN|nr:MULTISPECIES: hypothetical protein [Oscillatoriales]MBD2180305.1 hypothetical protein [Aerosakkonema funiforme FACHB-1375]MBD3557400.1 hypothetical protein [Planktothrix sp. FACHB-1355]